MKYDKFYGTDENRKIEQTLRDRGSTENICISPRGCVKMTTHLKVTPWHHLYSNIINATQQYYKHYTAIYYTTIL